MSVDLGAMTAVKVPGTHVPIIVGVGVLGAGYVAYRYYRSSRTATTAAQVGLAPQSVSTTNPSTVPTDTSVGGGYSGGVSPSYAGGGVSGVPTLGGAGTGLDQPQWAQAAEAYLIQQGQSPLDAVSAINGYTTGQYLPANEQTMVNTALGALGPFVGAPGAVTTPAPTSYTPPANTIPTPVVTTPTSYAAPTPSYSIVGTVPSSGSLQGVNYNGYHGPLYANIGGQVEHITSPYETLPAGTVLLGS